MAFGVGPSSSSCCTRPQLPLSKGPGRDHDSSGLQSSSIIDCLSCRLLAADEAGDTLQLRCASGRRGPRVSARMASSFSFGLTPRMLWSKESLWNTGALGDSSEPSALQKEAWDGQGLYCGAVGGAEGSVDVRGTVAGCVLRGKLACCPRSCLSRGLGRGGG
eukprot:scaffold37949_cov20-Tisochrysis_lutea.AAC.1